MAFVPQQLPEEEQNKFAPTGQTTPNPIPPQTGGSAGVGGQAKGTPPGVGSSTQFGSNAAKLSDYLTVNAPQVQNWGNQIAGGLSQNYNQTMGDVNKGFGDFNAQVQQGAPSADSNFISQAAANPTDFAKNPENVSKFQQAYQGNYTGPSNFESSEPYQGLNNEVNTAVQDAGLVGSPSGLGAYLNSKSGGQNQETPGMQTLDTALLQGNPAAQSAIKGAAQPYQNLQTYLSGQTAQANTNATNARDTASQNAAQYQNQFTGKGGIVPTFQGDLTSRLGAASGAASTSANQAKADLLAGKVTPDDMKLLGIDQNQLSNISDPMKTLQDAYGQNFDLGNYATIQDPSKVFSNPNAIATSDDYAKAAALNQLTGSDFSQFLDPSQAGNAGKQNNSLLGFDAKGANTDVNTALKQNDTSAINDFISYFTGDQASRGNNYYTQNPLTPDQVMTLIQQGHGFPDPAKNNQLKDAVFRYMNQWAPTPGLKTPGTNPPVIVDPNQPPANPKPIGFGGAGVPGIY